MDHQLVPASKKTSEVFCEVCGSGGARSCYNATICASCRVFFIRNAGRADRLRCSKQNNCSIAAGNGPRLICSACRFKKCESLHMRAEDVGKRVKSKSITPVFPKTILAHQKAELQLCLFPWGLRAIKRLKLCSNALEFANLFAEFERIVINEYGKSPSSTEINMDVELTDLLNNPALCSSREAAGWDYLHDVTMSTNYSFRNSYCRHATLLADFFNCIPQFHELDMNDRMKIMQQSFCAYVLSSMYYQRWKLKFPRVSGWQRIRRYKLTPEQEKSICETIMFMSNIMEDHVSLILSKYNVTDAEWAIIKIISIFYIPVGLSAKGEKLVFLTRTTYSTMLGSLIHESSPNLSLTEQLKKFKDYMSIAWYIRMSGEYGAKFYTTIVAENYGALKGTLSFDIHMRQL